ncbi:MAG: ATP-binding protein [Pseudomonadales bacterium]|nr:ATP-binding protein [Pseudomonadales bacterium]
MSLKINPLISLYTVLVMLLFAFPVQAAIESNQLSRETYQISRMQGVQYLRDPKHELLIADFLDSRNDHVGGIAWQTMRGSHLNFLYSPDTFWIRLNLTHRFSETKNWILDIDWPFLDNIQFYLLDSNNNLVLTQAAGDKSAAFESGNTYRIPHFEFSLSPNSEYTVILKVRSTSSIIVPIGIQLSDAYQTTEQAIQAAYGVFFGALMIMALYNILISVFSRDRSYAYYVAYLLGLTFYIGCVSGFGQQYLWGTLPWLNETGLGLSVAVSFLFGAFFVDHFLDLRKQNVWAHLLIKLAILVYSMLAIASFFVKEAWIVAVEQPLGMIACVILFFVALREWRKGRSVAKYFLIAWSALLVGTCTYTLLLLGLIPRNLFTEHVQIVGMFLEMFLLSLALADQIKIHRLEKVAAMKALFDSEREKRQTEADAKARSEFFAKMSHEIRTPIGGVIGIAELLRDTSLDGQQKRYVETIYHSGESLLAIVNDILDFSKMDAGKLELENIPFNLYQLLKECIDIVQVKIPVELIHFNIHMDARLPECLVGDPIRLRQVLLNLLSNAVKFTPQGEIIVAVKSDSATQGENLCALTIEVIDTGIGLTDAQAASLFKPFQQADKSTTRKFGGTGLGLAICKEIIELMGGRIGVRSEAGKGACFWFRLTLPVAGTEHPESINQAPQPALTFNKLKLLVAEDNPVNAMVLKGLLVKLGVDAIYTSDGCQALQAYQTDYEGIDAVLMDCEMPEMDGFEASNRIRQFESDKQIAPVPIVALTAHAFGDFNEKLRTNGMNLYFMKPATEAKLVELLTELAAAEQTGRAETQGPNPLLKDSAFVR